MKILVDTGIWSLVLRRQRRDLSPEQRIIATTLRELIAEDSAVLLGLVRQELLSGIGEQAQFERLQAYLRGFADEPPGMEDYEEAARCRNRCEARGIAASPVDMLICGFAIVRGLLVLTTDDDMVRYARHLPVHVARTSSQLRNALREQPRRNGKQAGE